jgi:hypothetical protein
MSVTPLPRPSLASRFAQCGIWPACGSMILPCGAKLWTSSMHSQPGRRRPGHLHPLGSGPRDARGGPVRSARRVECRTRLGGPSRDRNGPPHRGDRRRHSLRPELDRGLPGTARCKDFWLWTTSGLVYGALLGTGAYVYNLAPTDGNLLFNDLLLPVMFGVPSVLVSQMLAEMIFVGLSSYQRRHDDDAASQDDSDSDREWLGRAAGWYLVTALGWFVVTFLIFAGSLVLTSLSHEIVKWMAPLGGVGGVVTALLGKSSLTPGPGEAPKGRKPLLSTGIILGIAAPLFAAALLIFLSAALDALLLEDSLVTGCDTRRCRSWSRSAGRGSRRCWSAS